MKIKYVHKVVLKYSWLILLIGILIFSYYIRAINIVPDRLLSFDPIFQYRFTKYFADWGHLPLWDELTYYVGRVVTPEFNPPLMMYLTSILYWLQPFGWSLLTTAAYASAVYGALIALSVFLLVKELSNEYGGLLAAILIGTAPQILVRTFGSSYDTDQMALLFLPLTLYLWLYFSKKKTVASFSLAIIGFVSYFLAWHMSVYSLLIVIAFLIIYFIFGLITKKGLFKKFKLNENFSFKEFKTEIILFVILFLILSIISFILNFNLFDSIASLIGFAIQPETKIVNISIAELQPFSIFNLEGWILAMGRFIIGENFTDNIIFISFIFFILFSFISVFYIKRDIKKFSFLITIILVTIYTTFRGIRFTEFSTVFFIILIGIGFGCFIEWSSKKNQFLKSTAIGLGLFMVFISLIIGNSIGKNLGPDINSNWDNAWTFLKTQTPEFSLVGTWWDPGHMITGLAERRVIADGAHCGTPCMYTINDRITDLGKIMVTSDENESLSLIRKYQGDSPKVYWIASDDLIGKFQWLQYFGIGCDSRLDRSCPLYMQIPEQSRSTDNAGNIVLRKYGSVILYTSGDIPIPIYTEGINALLFDEVIIYNGTEPVPIKFTNEEKNILITGLKPLEKQLNIRFTNQSIPMAVWIPQHYAYIVIIPQNLRESIFTKMFFLEGKYLEHFKQVFRNEQVKIYEVI